VSNLLLRPVRNSSSDCRVPCLDKFIFAFKVSCRLLYTSGSPFKMHFTELMRLHIRAQYHGVVYIANKIHIRMCHAQGRDDVNLLDLTQLTQLICL